MAESPDDRVYLSDLSERDKPWDKHGSERDSIQKLFGGFTPTWSHAGKPVSPPSRRIAGCTQQLEYQMAPVENSEGEVKLKLSNAYFCRCQQCPMCQWRRSAKWQARLLTAMPKMLADRPTLRFLFLTVTVKNVPADELRPSVDHLIKSWARFVKKTHYPGLGFVRAIEVTRSKDGSAHPHIHALVAVGSGYFGGTEYLSQGKWRQLWKEAARLDYEPQVDVRAIRPKNVHVLHGDDAKIQTAYYADIAGVIAETVKYTTKLDEKFIDGTEISFEDKEKWLADLATGLHHKTLIATGGIFKDYLKVDDEDSEDLVNIGDEDDEELEGGTKVFFRWARDVKRYAMNS